MHRFLTALVLSFVMLFAPACVSSEKRDDETEQEHKHRDSVASIERGYRVVSIFASFMRMNGKGSDSFWEKYDKADSTFLVAFAVYKKSPLSNRDLVDVALDVLEALADELHDTLTEKEKTASAAFRALTLGK